ncbi:apolipophorins-like [Brevipalpus obovatus]|uniref:apolipophorins-like n=1 Tax=Brevipalpus obovatus TaxID=246614 RepID=UPI003D9F509C
MRNIFLIQKLKIVLFLLLSILSSVKPFPNHHQHLDQENSFLDDVSDYVQSWLVDTLEMAENFIHETSNYFHQSQSRSEMMVDKIAIKVVESHDDDGNQRLSEEQSDQISVGLRKKFQPNKVEKIGNTFRKIPGIPVSVDSNQDTVLELEKDFDEHLSELQSLLSSQTRNPKRSLALLISKQQIVTFDQSSFEFKPSNCSHMFLEILSHRLFISLEYSIQSPTANTNVYDMSLEIKLRELIIKINPNRREVKIFNHHIEMPFIYGSTMIIRTSNSIMLTDSTIQGETISLECHLNYDLCLFSVPQSYQNKTRGMAGYFDGNSANDLELPWNRKIARNGGELSYGWTKNQCISSHKNPPSPGKLTSKALNLCENLRDHFYIQLNSYAPGLDVAEKYFKMCSKLMPLIRNRGKLEKTFCNLAASAVIMAKEQGIELTPPTQCLMCGKDLKFGSRSKVIVATKDGSGNADIVFVVHEKLCLAYAVDNLIGLAKQLEEEVVRQGMDKPLYGLISFGRGKKDDLPYLNLHTANGNIMFDSDSIGRAVDGLDLSRSTPETVNILEAIARASQYPFRKGSSKTIVLMSCQSCDNFDAKQSRFDYNDIRSILLTEGIVLHVISDQQISVPRRFRGSSVIAGIDLNTTYLLDSPENKVGKSTIDRQSLKRQIILPKDICVILSHLSDGCYFPISLDQSLDKNWQRVLAQRISISAVPKPCQQCDCALSDDSIQSQIFCRPCSLPKTPQYN